MADNKKTVNIEFKATGYGDLTRQLKGLAKSSEDLIRSNNKLNKINKKIPISLNKMTMDLKELGSSFKKTGINVKVLKRAYDGHRTSIEKVRRATKAHIRTLKGLDVQNQKVSKGTRILGGTFAVIRSKLLLVNFAMGLGIRQLAKFSEQASKVESMERAFNTLSSQVEISSESLDKLKNATDNTMSNFDLFQQANNAMILGVSKNSDEMAEMFDIAQRLGRALGRDTASSVESLITGIGRQSRLMLDNIGIIVKADEAYESYAKSIGTTADKLTDAEKKQAFLTATMESARAKITTLKDEVLTNQDAYDKFTASASNLSTEIGTTLQPKVSFLAKAFSTLADNITKSLEVNRLARKEYDMDLPLQERREIVINRIAKAEKLLAKQRAGGSDDIVTTAKAEGFIASQRVLLHNLNRLIRKDQEKSIKLKQECMRQISLSKLKLNVIEKKERVAPDLEPLPIKKHQMHIEKKYKHIGRNQILYYDW